MKYAANLAIISMISAIALSACGKSGDSSDVDDDELIIEPLESEGWADLGAGFTATDGSDVGYVAMKDAPSGGVLIRITLKGLAQGWHGSHLHQIGDCSDGDEGFKLSGGHIDPDDREHGFLNPNGSERADLPNLYVGADGRATAEIFNDTITLFASEAGAAELGPFALMDDDGFALVVHADPDDHLSQPIGGAGQRVACAAFTGAP